MRTNRILLTSLSNQGDRKSHRYFYYADDGVYRYCDGLSVAEAGAKYILSEVNIDEIIVLGAGRTYDPGEENKRIELRSWSDFTSKDAKDLSEYSFFQYRLAQFLDNIDMEALDVLADLDPKRQEELKRGYDAFISEIQGEPGYRPDRVFHMISRDSRFYDLLMTKVDIASEHELLWLERFFYTKLAETMKMVCREDNEDIRICFIPTSRDRTNNSVPAENVAQIIKVINASDADEIEIYMDMQGLASAEGYTILGLLTMLGNDVNNRISVKEIITSHYSRGRFANPIDNNEMKRYEINSLVSGMDAFIRYGKVDEMLKYWQTRGIENKHIDSLLYAMHRVDEGISLCNTSDLESGINMLKYVFNNTPMEELHEVETNIFRILEDTIRNDYGKLLEEGDLDPLELVNGRCARSSTSSH